MRNKIIILIILISFLFITLNVYASSPPTPFVIGLRANISSAPLTDFQVCIENIRTLERMCGFTNENGEYLFNLANFAKGYSDGDLIKNIICVDTPICEENYAIRKVDIKAGGYILDFKSYQSHEEMKNIDANLICRKYNDTFYTNITIMSQGKIFWNKLIEQETTSQLINIPVPSNEQYLVIIECIDYLGNIYIPEILLSNKSESINENQSLIFNIYNNNTNVNNIYQNITNSKEFIFIKNLIINNKVTLTFISFGGISILIYFFRKRRKTD